MTGFIDSPRFPDWISVWAKGGRGYSTSVVETLGGYESRQANWAMSLGRWDISDALVAVSPQFAAYNTTVIIKLFRAAKGQVYAFRFKDFRDYLDEGAGVFGALGGNQYQMYKQYVQGGNTELQIINKPAPASGSYTGITVVGGTGPSVDYTTGIVTMGSGIPTSWTGQYDIPCRFADDFPDLTLGTEGALAVWSKMNLIETRDIT